MTMGGNLRSLLVHLAKQKTKQDQEKITKSSKSHIKPNWKKETKATSKNNETKKETFVKEKTVILTKKYWLTLVVCVGGWGWGWGGGGWKV